MNVFSTWKEAVTDPSPEVCISWWSACSSGSEAGKKEPENPIFQGQLHCIWKPLLVAKAKPTFTKLCLGHDLVCFSIAVNTMTKSNLEGKDLFG